MATQTSPKLTQAAQVTQAAQAAQAAQTTQTKSDNSAATKLQWVVGQVIDNAIANQQTVILDHITTTNGKITASIDRLTKSAQTDRAAHTAALDQLRITIEGLLSRIEDLEKKIKTPPAKMTAQQRQDHEYISGLPGNVRMVQPTIPTDLFTSECLFDAD